MEVSEDAAITIGNLPADLIRLIIRFIKPETMHPLRQISRNWDSQVLVCKDRLPTIHEVLCIMHDPYLITLRITLNHRHFEHFGVDSLPHHVHSAKERIVEFQLRLSDVEAKDNITKLFRRCSKNEKFILSLISTFNDFIKFLTLKQCLGNVRVLHFKATKLIFGNQPSRAFVLDFVERHFTEHCSIFNDGIRINEVLLCPFVSKALETLKSLEIEESRPISDPNLDASEHFWKTIVQEYDDLDYNARFYSIEDPSKHNFVRIRMHLIEIDQ